MNCATERTYCGWVCTYSTACLSRGKTCTPYNTVSIISGREDGDDGNDDTGEQMCTADAMCTQ